MIATPDDALACPDAMQQAFGEVGSVDKQFVSFPGLCHETLNEDWHAQGRRDEPSPLSTVMAWLQDHV